MQPGLKSNVTQGRRVMTRRTSLSYLPRLPDDSALKKVSQTTRITKPWQQREDGEEEGGRGGGGREWVDYPRGKHWTDLIKLQIVDPLWLVNA